MHKVNMKGEPVEENEEMERMKKEGEKVLCNLCGKGYGHKDQLRQHVKFVHDKEFSLNCHVCGLRVRQERRLNIHLSRVHREDPETRRLEEVEGLRWMKCELKGCTGVVLREGERDKRKEKHHGGGEEGGRGLV